MNRIPFIGAAALALIAGAAPAFAQTEIVARPNPDADRLANDIRTLASDPRDVRTLLDAGMTSARLGDTSAALAFFQRAEALEPGNPRIAAGRGMALVRLERPGEALRLFQEAEAKGVPAREYAADRAFAYDLLGQPGLAQRDYKLALSADRDDETVRRYALSQGITGDREEAMRTLEPLLRRSDRAAWRARAFILAMSGDTAGAEKIAASMMPGTMGQALSPFFRRLATLGPADRAFAVHFGELSPTQARIADARLAPDLPRYVPAPRPVQVAAVQPAPAPAPEPKGRDRRSKKDRERDEKLAAIAAARQPAAPAPQPAPDADLPPPPRFVQPAQAIVQPIPTPRREDEPNEVVERKPVPTPTPAPVRVASAPVRVTPAPAPTPAPTPTPSFTPAPAAATLARAESVVVRPAPRPEPAPPGPARVGQEDSVLAAIVGGITIPAEELATVTATPTDPVPVSAPEPEPVRVVETRPAPAPPKPEPKPVAAKPDPKKPDPKAKTAAEDAKEGTKPDPKAKKPEPKKPDPAKTDPARVWVQVAGGANPDTLAKAWKGVVTKAPAAMKGKSAWTTPLRATNRVLAGPFKTGAEAQAFVNTLGKAGVSAFVFTSEAGQKVTKLAL
ncbi:SPOR domain-containing protein [Sphingomonas sp. HITSZ_GF]|uniref:SPOR domain-containing protein n=1 Tax=Sphingomonas sp. HITSZ_GF TaxID=3037247 RepID=UPI00240E0F0F|nr:SPOR domain-containing protein [Sphingomonas sp. HITSZ_GF]MDG2533799.1 SPOR domain-containing protein [Sphingomonas sp. HITSZ_GF]